MLCIVLCTVSVLIVSTTLLYLRESTANPYLHVIMIMYTLDLAGCLFHVESNYFNEFSFSEKSQMLRAILKDKNSYSPISMVQRAFVTHH